MSRGASASGLPEGLALQALELAREAVCVVDGRGDEMAVVWVNPAFERLTGYSAEEVVGRNPRFLQGGDQDQPEVAELREAIADGRAVEVTLRNYRADGTLFWHALRLEPLESAGGAWWIGFSRDATLEQKLAADLGRTGQQLEALQVKLAQVDPVDRTTGLNNARAFEAELTRSWFVCAREGRSLVVFAFAPDFFEVYEQTFGRTAAESGLRMLSRAVAGCFRRASDATGRIGETQFGALALDMDAEHAEAHARRVLERARDLAIHNPKAAAGRYLTLSAGIAIGRPGPEGDWEALRDAARRALAESQEDAWERVRLTDLSGEKGQG
jgi:PAS domain S-box-containing protein/diguanylate cyclase (GGDEF)-like protein